MAASRIPNKSWNLLLSLVFSLHSIHIMLIESLIKYNDKGKQRELSADSLQSNPQASSTHHQAVHAFNQAFGVGSASPLSSAKESSPEPEDDAYPARPRKRRKADSDGLTPKTKGIDLRIPRKTRQKQVVKASKPLEPGISVTISETKPKTLPSGPTITHQGLKDGPQDDKYLKKRPRPTQGRKLIRRKPPARPPSIRHGPGDNDQLPKEFICRTLIKPAVLSQAQLQRISRLVNPHNKDHNNATKKGSILLVSPRKIRRPLQRSYSGLLAKKPHLEDLSSSSALLRSAKDVTPDQEEDEEEEEASRWADLSDDAEHSWHRPEHPLASGSRPAKAKPRSTQQHTVEPVIFKPFRKPAMERLIIRPTLAASTGAVFAPYDPSVSLEYQAEEVPPKPLSFDALAKS